MNLNSHNIIEEHSRNQNKKRRHNNLKTMENFNFQDRTDDTCDNFGKVLAHTVSVNCRLA